MRTTTPTRLGAPLAAWPPWPSRAAGLRLAAAPAAARAAPAASRCPTSSRSTSSAPPRARSACWPGPATSRTAATTPRSTGSPTSRRSSGCQVTVKTFGTSDEAVQLMRTGQYDVVSASGDATLRLIAAGDVEPMNTDLITNYPDIFDALKNQPWNSVNGRAVRHPARPRRQPADVPHRPGQAGARLAGRPSSTTPRSRRARSRPTTRPIYIADAALYLMATKPDLGIKDPYALDEQAARRGGRPAQEAEGRTSASTGRTTSRRSRPSRTAPRPSAPPGRSSPTWPRARRPPSRRCCPRRARPAGRTPGWWAPSRKHKTCAYKFIDHIVSPKANAADRRVLRRGAGQQEGLRRRRRTRTTARSSTPRTRTTSPRSTTGTRPISACLDGRTDVKCTDYAEWTKAWTEIRNS